MVQMGYYFFVGGHVLSVLKPLWHGLNYYGNQGIRQLEEARLLGEKLKTVG